jgi:uncharacterized membrane protein
LLLSFVIQASTAVGISSTVNEAASSYKIAFVVNFMPPVSISAILILSSSGRDESGINGISPLIESCLPCSGKL